MDPALLHQRLDMLLKSGKQSSRRRSLSTASETTEQPLGGEPAPQRFRSLTDNEPKTLGKLDVSCQRQTTSQIGERSSYSHQTTSIIGLRDESSTTDNQQISTISSTTTSSNITDTPELRPATTANADTATVSTTITSSMKKAKILNRMRRQQGSGTSISFELPPVASTSSVDDRDATTSTAIDVAATPVGTQPLHLPSPSGMTTVLKTPSAKFSQRPHPVTPRQTVPSSASATPKEQTSQQKKRSLRPFPHLTLSAYRRPEEMIRLTSSDPSRQLENDYDLRAPGCKVIGHGAYSTVRSALRLKDHQMVAIKSISKFDAMRARRLRRPGSKHMDEWEIMRLLEENPYTLTLLDLLETDEEIHLVTEYCEGGELFDAIKRRGGTRSSFRRGRFSEPQAARITCQLLQALQELHRHDIIHRDIKPENVLLVKKEEDCVEGEDMIQVKLGDFGVARVHHHHHHGSSLETASAASSDGESSPSTPGLLLADKVDPPPEGCRRNCGPASDMFSLGVTLYILLCGFPPVFCEHQVQFPDAYWQDISLDAKALLQSMLQKDPEQRVSAEDALKNRWVRQQNKAPRGRRGSISANLELVRSHLSKSLGGNLTSASTSIRSSLVTKKSLIGKRSRRGSIHFTSPKRRRCLELPLTELYTCQEKRDARAAKDRSDASPAPRDMTDGIAVKVACTT